MCSKRRIKPIITATVTKGTLIHADEYDNYARLSGRGYRHKTVSHGHGEYARDEDRDGFHEVNVNTNGKLLVVVTLAASPLRHLPGKAPDLSRVRSVCS
jgi:ISXO2-like transposase domain